AVDAATNENDAGIGVGGTHGQRRGQSRMDTGAGNGRRSAQRRLPARLHTVVPPAFGDSNRRRRPTSSPSPTLGHPFAITVGNAKANRRTSALPLAKTPYRRNLTDTLRAGQFTLSY